MNQIIDFPQLPKYNPLDVVMVKPTAWFQKPRVCAISQCVWEENSQRWVYFFFEGSSGASEEEIIGRVADNQPF